MIGKIKFKFKWLILTCYRGSMIVWRMAQYFPEAVKALASTCIDYAAPADTFIDLDTVIQHVPAMEYQVN
jgi:soluble epoxide hydrolase/lipid-phosphate phosphatase